MSKSVLVAGFTTRHVAVSAAKAGYDVYAVDHFCDADLTAVVKDHLAFDELDELPFAIEEMMAKYNHFHKLTGISYFDLDCEPGKNGLSGNCCISFDKMMDILPKTYEYLKDNKYFTGAIGWKLGYDESSFHKGFCSTRPQIYLTLPVELEIQFKAEQKALADDIARFYANCRYWGD